MDPTFFKNPAEFHRWLAKNHAKASELWVGFYKKGARKTGITYSEALDEALLFGWIDAVRRSIDAERWAIRFTPRKPNSIWSNVNIKRAQELLDEGKMLAPGRKAFESRQESRSGVYSHEQAETALTLTSAEDKCFRQNKRAWEFFGKQPASYRRAATWWVVSAKKAETRVRRLNQLIATSEEGKRLAQFTPRR